MKTKVSIEIEKTESGYSAYSPEIEGSVAEGNSLGEVIYAIQQTIESYWQQKEEEKTKTTAQSLLDLFDSLTADMSESERKNLPNDGAQQHDHYIYGTPKRDQ